MFTIIINVDGKIENNFILLHHMTSNETRDDDLHVGIQTRIIKEINVW